MTVVNPRYRNTPFLLSPRRWTFHIIILLHHCLTRQSSATLGMLSFLLGMTRFFGFEGVPFPHIASDRLLYFIVVRPVIPFHYFVVVFV